MQKLGYNGYANHPTWLMSVWEVMASLADEAKEAEKSSVDASWCEDAFDDMVKYMMPHSKIGENIVTDLLDYAKNEIDWDEVSHKVNEILHDD